MALPQSATPPSRTRSSLPLSMAEKVDAEVVNGSKSPTAAKTEELIDSAKEVYSSLAVRAVSYTHLTLPTKA